MQEAAKTLSRPAQLWHSAVKAVRGGNTERLVEEFTAEMTLVAEGLAEDQGRLHEAVARIGAQLDQAEQRTGSELQALETMLRESRNATDARLEEMSRRLSVLEKQLDGRRKSVREHGLIDRVTVIVSIAAGAWVLTALIGLFA